MLPEIIKKTLPPLKKVIGNIDEMALINTLNAKLMNMITIKGTTFKQYSNGYKNTLSYYGINFADSGSAKDYSINCINRYLLPFVKEQIEEKIEDYTTEIEIKLEQANKKEKKIYEKILDDIRVPNFELENPNITGLYAEAQQIKDIGFGGIFIRIGEFGDYLDGITSGDKAKKELYANLKNIYEGEIAPSIIAGVKNRQTLYNIPIQCLLYTDFENLKNEKIKKFYVNSLKTGFARRCFIYMPQNQTSMKLAYVEHPQIRNEAIAKLKELSGEYKKIFDRLLYNTTYEFTEEANEKIFFNYQNQCIDYYNQSKDSIIVKNERKDSFWKIAKLSVLYSILDGCNIVKSKHTEMALDFYNKINSSLKTVIEKRELSEVELFAEYMLNDVNKIYTTTDLRHTGIIKNKNIFKEYFYKLLPDLQEEIEFYGYYLVNYDGMGAGNHKAYQLIKKEE